MALYLAIISFPISGFCILLYKLLNNLKEKYYVPYVFIDNKYLTPQVTEKSDSDIIFAGPSHLDHINPCKRCQRGTKCTARNQWIIKCDLYKEVLQEKLYHDIRDLSLSKQQKIAEDLLNELVVVEKNQKFDRYLIRPSKYSSAPEVIVQQKDVVLGIDDKLLILSSFTDPRDGNKYKTVEFGGQIWMSENLRYIPLLFHENEDSGIWVYDTKRAYERKVIFTDYYKMYGCLYEWKTAKLVCPEGWHLPSNDEWNNLIDYLGGDLSAGGKLKSLNGWEPPNIGATNVSNFTALPGGVCQTKERFDYVGSAGFWWSSSEYGQWDALYEAWYICLNSDNSSVYVNKQSKNHGMSIRCIKDSETSDKEARYMNRM